MPLKLKRTSEGVIRSIDDHPGVICVGTTDSGLSWLVQSNVDPVPIRDTARERGETSVFSTQLAPNQDAEFALTTEEFVRAISDPITLMTAVKMLPEVASSYVGKAVAIGRFETARVVIEFVEETETLLHERAFDLVRLSRFGKESS